MRNAVVASTYSETATLGQQTGATTFGTSSDEKGGITITVPVGGVWVKTVHIEYNSFPTLGKIKPILMTGHISTDTLVKVGQELSPGAVSSATEIVMNWNGDGSAYFIPAGTYVLGYHTSLNATARALSGGLTYWRVDSYADGTASTWGGTPSTSPNTLNVWMPYSVTGP